jgi:hypothetical protein
MTTNLERWNFFMRDFESPQLYIDWGLYSMVSACLQRRVWYGPDIDPLYPNEFIILVGIPATGKGRVIGQVANIVKTWKLDPAKIKSTDKDPLLIPVSAESCTLERLTQYLAASTRAFEYDKPDKTKGIYFHTSLACFLEELATLFRKNTEDLVSFLTVAWDCKDYRRETKDRGHDIIRRVCVTMLSGTQPEFICKCFDNDLIAGGFASRTIFVYEEKPRFRLFDFEFSDEQIEARKHIIGHLEKLTKLHGKVRFSEEAWQFAKGWYEDVNFDKARPNKSPVLDGYYGRAKAHLIKVSMLTHFADSTDMIVTLDDVKIALEILQRTELKMHHALRISAKSSNNPLADITDAIDKHLSKQPDGVQVEELQLQFRLRRTDLVEILNSLKAVGRIELETTNNVTYARTKK